MMPLSVRVLVAAVLACGIGASSSPGQTTATRPASAPLWHAFGRPAADVEDLDASLALLNRDARSAVEQRLDFARRYKPTLTISPRLTEEEIPIAAARSELERTIVGLAGTTKVRDEAVLFAQTAVLFYEWEGESEAPLGEAGFAQDYLQRNPQTAIGPFIDLFLLHRYRAAFEAAEYEADAAAARAAAEHYLAVWKRIQLRRDVVIRAVADDIDGAEFVYMKAPHHPRAPNGR
jgi:hypothetical protein